LARSQPNVFVSTTGSDDTGDGGQENPFASIQQAIDQSVDGDTVSVAAGTYTENINFNGKNIALIGADRVTTIIDGNQSGSVVTLENGEDPTAVLSGFTITNGLANLNEHGDTFGGGIYLEGSSPTLEFLGLMVGLQQKTNLPIAAVRAFLEITVVSIGWYLGGTVGVGTLLFAFGIGPAVALGLFLTGKLFN